MSTPTFPSTPLRTDIHERALNVLEIALGESATAQMATTDQLIAALTDYIVSITDGEAVHHAVSTARSYGEALDAIVAVVGARPDWASTGNPSLCVAASVALRWRSITDRATKAETALDGVKKLVSGEWVVRDVEG